MTTYFGFIPSDDLQQQIDHTFELIENHQDLELYTYQRKVTEQVAHELIDNLLTQIVTVIENEGRQKKMRKLIATIHSAVETLLKHVLTKRSNEKAMDSLLFLHNDCLFTDNQGIRRVGFQLSEKQSKLIVNNLNQGKDSDAPHQHLQVAMDAIIHVNLEHFLKEFSKTLHLNMIKRGAVPIAEAAIDKASQIAIHKLLPPMPNAACYRLIAHFDKFVVEKNA